MSCRFSSTLSRLLIVLVGNGDVSLDVLGDVVGDDVGVDVFDDDDDDSCSVAYISDLMASISLCFLPSADSKAVCQRPRKHFLTPAPPPPDFIESQS
jgi:hypothetical protein